MAYKNPEQQREYQRKWKAARRQAWLADKTCFCGSTDRLEIDHIDRSTKVTHRVWTWSEAKRNEELAKCQVLCYKHHKEKTRSENITLEHGTYAMRNTHGCTCPKCKAYVRDSKRAWRSKAGRN